MVAESQSDFFSMLHPKPSGDSLPDSALTQVRPPIHRGQSRIPEASHPVNIPVNEQIKGLLGYCNADVLQAVNLLLEKHEADSVADALQKLMS